MTPYEVTDSVKQSVLSVDPRAKVILFGSRARGDYSAQSDWDFLILTSRSSDEPFKRRIREALIDTELQAEAVISTLIYSQRKWTDYKLTSLYKHISKDGLQL